MKRFAGCLAAAVVGVLTGTAATLVHPISGPLALAVAATLASCWACPPGWVRMSYALTWIVPVGFFMVPRPDGGYLIGSDGPGYLLVALGMVVISVAVVTIPRRRQPLREPRQAAGESTVSGVGP
ncbi:MAG: hypothetical protein ACSLEW_04620 [Nocardioides sp.]